jgi:hypothetical protein
MTDQEAIVKWNGRDSFSRPCQERTSEHPLGHDWLATSYSAKIRLCPPSAAVAHCRGTSTTAQLLSQA